jgi:hypothetical protein
MDIEQLLGRRSRLQQELAIAYQAQPWHSARIDRLADDLLATECQIAALQPADEQRGEGRLGFVR